MIKAQNFRRPGYGYSVEDRRLLDEKFPDSIVHDGGSSDKGYFAPEEVISGPIRTLYWDPEFLLPDIVGIEVRYPQGKGL